MPTHRTRISIIGCGHVGTSCAFAILHNRLSREIVLIGDTKAHVQGVKRSISNKPSPSARP